jgi:exopolyphosphatase/guanosine-5'-triphosphate,3'-diphosphate pyrophosphatase
MVSLGRSVFADRSRAIDRKTLQQSKNAFAKFSSMFTNHKVEKYRAVGTSALRDASNADDLIDIASEFGIAIDIITGEEEANLIRIAIEHSVDLSDKKTAGLFDIGGGSAEFTLIKNQVPVFSVSERVGTIRLLKAVAEQKIGLERFSERVRRIVDNLGNQIQKKLSEETLDILVGTGGNIEELGRLRAKIIPNKKKTDKVKLPELDYIIELLEPMTIEERQEQFGFRPDRADVILPAAIVLREVMRRAKCNKVYVPGVGLKEGVLIQQFLEIGELS